MKDIKFILAKIIKRRGFGQQLLEKKVQDIFSQTVENVLGRGLAERVKPLYLKEGILTVASLSETAMLKTSYQEVKIIDGINKELGEEVVKSLHYLS